MTIFRPKLTVGDTAFTNTDLYINSAEGPDGNTYLFAREKTGSLTTGQGDPSSRGFGAVSWQLDEPVDTCDVGDQFAINTFVKTTLVGSGAKGGRIGILQKMEQGTIPSDTHDHFKVGVNAQVISYVGEGGHSLPTVTSIVAVDGIEAATATVTFGSAHGLVEGNYITFLDATPAAYNHGQWKIESVPSSTTVLISVPNGTGSTTVQPTARNYRGLYTGMSPYVMVRNGNYTSALCGVEVDVITDGATYPKDTLGILIADCCYTKGDRIHAGITFHNYQEDNGMTGGYYGGRGWDVGIAWENATGIPPTHSGTTLIGYYDLGLGTPAPWDAKRGIDLSGWTFDNGTGADSGELVKGKGLAIFEGRISLAENTPTSGYSLIDNAAAPSCNLMVDAQNALVLRAGAEVSVNSQMVLNWTLEDYPNDTALAAAIPTFPIGGIYRNGSVLMVRVS